MKIVDVKSYFRMLQFDTKNYVSDNIQDHSIMVLPLAIMVLPLAYLLKLCLKY